MPESVLHALAEHPEKIHVPQDVEQVAVQEHRRKNGQRLVVGRDESKALSDVFNGSRRPSGQKDQGIRENQRINNPGVMLDREITFERDDKHDRTGVPMTGSRPRRPVRRRGEVEVEPLFLGEAYELPVIGEVTAVAVAEVLESDIGGPPS